MLQACEIIRGEPVLIHFASAVAICRTIRSATQAVEQPQQRAAELPETICHCCANPASYYY